MSITAIETAIANDLADGNSRTAAGKITQLIRAVIADEAAKPVSFVGKSADEVFAKPQPAEPRAEGDVPECDACGGSGFSNEQHPNSAFDACGSCGGSGRAKVTPEKSRINRFTGLPHWSLDAAKAAIKITRQAWSDSHMPSVIARSMLKHCESELTRRVAEATAERDRRIAELESDLKHADNRNESRKRWTAQKERQIVEKDKRIAFLDEQCSRNQQAYYAMTAERDALKQQLAASQAEVERLKRDAEQGQAVAEVANMHSWNGCEHSKVLSVHIAEELTELTKLREEVARLTRPVEDVDWKAMWKKYFETPGFAHECLRRIVEPILQAERNAREAAETERDELREFVRTKSVWSSCFGPTVSFRLDNRGHNIPDAELDRLLAEFRAEKGKVATDGHAPTNS